MTGGPNNWGARFQYPADQAPDTYVQYNYKDTVIAEWTSWAKNSSVTNLRIWWWDPTMQGKGWAPLDLDTVAQNGTKSYKLDKVKNSGAGYYLGQWNLNFTRADKAPAEGLTLSQKFNVTFDDDIAPRTFSRGMAPLTTSTASVSKATNVADPPISFVTVTPSSTPTAAIAAGATAASATASASASATPASGLSGGAIAGVVIGLLIALALGAVGAFFLWKRQHGKKDAGAAAAAGAAAGGGYPPQQPPPQYTQYPGQHPTYNQGYPQGYNQGYPQAYSPAGAAPMAGAAGYGSDYKQPLPQPGAPQNEYYNKQQAYVQQSHVSPTGYQQQQQGHGEYSELPGHTVSDNRAMRQELPG